MTPRPNPSDRATSIVAQPGACIPITAIPGEPLACVHITENHVSGRLLRPTQATAGSSRRAVRRTSAATCHKWSRPRRPTKRNATAGMAMRRRCKNNQDKRPSEPEKVTIDTSSAANPPRVQVLHGRQVQPPLARRDVRDVGRPGPVGRPRLEPVIQRIPGDGAVVVRGGGTPELPLGLGGDPVRPHQLRHGVHAASLPPDNQLRVDPRAALRVRAMPGERLSVDRSEWLLPQNGRYRFALQ